MQAVSGLQCGISGRPPLSRPEKFSISRIRFDRALAYLQKASFREVMRPEIAEAISEAEKHYRQWGLRHQAEIISTSPWLRFLWAEE